MAGKKGRHTTGGSKPSFGSEKDGRVVRPSELPVDLISTRESYGLDIDHIKEGEGTAHQRQFVDVLKRHAGESKKRSLMDFMPEYLESIDFNETEHDPDAFQQAGIYQQELSRDAFSGGLETIQSGETYQMRAVKRIKARKSKHALARTEALAELLGFPSRDPTINTAGGKLGWTIWRTGRL